MGREDLVDGSCWDGSRCEELRVPHDAVNRVGIQYGGHKGTVFPVSQFSLRVGGVGVRVAGGRREAARSREELWTGERTGTRAS